jgi:hypothetical protein
MRAKKDRAKKDRGKKIAQKRKRKSKQTDLIKEARRVVNATHTLVAKRRELEDRLRSWGPKGLLDSWKAY